MRQLLNTLFVTSEDIYLSLDGENVVANRGGEAVARYPLHTLQSIVSLSLHLDAAAKVWYHRFAFREDYSDRRRTRFILPF